MDVISTIPPGRLRYFWLRLAVATPNRRTIIIHHDSYIVMVRMAHVDVLKETNQR